MLLRVSFRLICNCMMQELQEHLKTTSSAWSAAGKYANETPPKKGLCMSGRVNQIPVKIASKELGLGHFVCILPL